MHTPVFLDKVLAHVDSNRDTRYIDCTLGQGGHTIALAKMGLHVLAIDADHEQVELFRRQRISEKVRRRITIVEGNFRDVAQIAHTHHFENCDGILFDLGLSMIQLEREEGFSYRHQHQPLNMIIETVAKQGGATRAADVVAQYDSAELTAVFEKWGEVPDASRLAHSIVTKRTKDPILTVGDLAHVVQETLGERHIPKVFQALRIEVNSELSNIQRGLEGACEVLKPNGIIQIISFHSVEDRVIKMWAKHKGLTPIAKYVGSREKRASFERSAVLRILQKTL